MKDIKKIFIVSGLLLFVIALGSVGYMILEGYTFTDAFYMTIITMATVGFQEVKELSVNGKWFTSFLIFFSIGIFVYAVNMFTRYAVDGVFRNYYRTNKLKKRIKKLKDHVVICGYGRNGRQAAAELIDHDESIIIIENDESVIEKLQENPDILYIQGDATQDEILEMASLDKAKALITTLPDDAANLFVVLTSRELNPKLKVISRASDDHSDRKLKRAGAANVIMSDKIGGQRMAKLVAQPDVVEFLDFIMLQSSENIILEELTCKNLASCFNGKSMRELDINNDSGANIIGMKRGDNTYVINPLPETAISYKDKLFALGTKKQINSLKEILIKGV